jgi:glycosyltransferase involved in cell wall biosynthesis
LSSEKHLAVIGRRLCEPLTGVGRYLQSLLYHWGRFQTPFHRITVYTPAEPNLPSGTIQAPVEVRIVRSRMSPLLWENLALPPRMGDVDLVFGPYTLPWALAGRGVVSNLGIYESRPADFSMLDRWRTTPFFKHSAQKARWVLANSESTRSDLVRHYGVDPARTEVIYLGVDPELSPAEGAAAAELPQHTRERYGLPGGPFFLFVGKLSKRRNVPLLLEAFAQLRAGGATPHNLIIIGPDYLGLDVPGRAAELDVREAVHYLPHVPMEFLVDFYRAAAAFVLPTEHEGFSLTIPESMACGAPVIVFDHAALEAGLREAAWVIHEPTATKLCEAMRRVIRDAAWRVQLREASLRCAQGFRWEQTARQTMSSLDRALNAAPARLKGTRIGVSK